MRWESSSPSIFVAQLSRSSRVLYHYMLAYNLSKFFEESLP